MTDTESLPKQVSSIPGLSGYRNAMKMGVPHAFQLGLGIQHWLERMREGILKSGSDSRSQDPSIHLGPPPPHLCMVKRPSSPAPAAGVV